MPRRSRPRSRCRRDRSPRSPFPVLPPGAARTGRTRGHSWGSRRSRPCSCPPDPSAGSARTKSAGAAARPAAAATAPVSLPRGTAHDPSFVPVPADPGRCGSGIGRVRAAAPASGLPPAAPLPAAGAGLRAGGVQQQHGPLPLRARGCPTSAGSSWRGDLVMVSPWRSGRVRRKLEPLPFLPRPGASRCGVSCPRRRWTGRGRCRPSCVPGPDRRARTGQTRAPPPPGSCRCRGPGLPRPRRSRWRRRKCSPGVPSPCSRAFSTRLRRIRSIRRSSISTMMLLRAR